MSALQCAALALALALRIHMETLQASTGHSDQPPEPTIATFPRARACGKSKEPRGVMRLILRGLFGKCGEDLEDLLKIGYDTALRIVLRIVLVGRYEAVDLHSKGDGLLPAHFNAGTRLTMSQFVRWSPAQGTPVQYYSTFCCLVLGLVPVVELTNHLLIVGIQDRQRKELNLSPYEAKPLFSAALRLCRLPRCWISFDSFEKFNH